MLKYDSDKAGASFVQNMRAVATGRPHKARRPSLATMERWMDRGVAKATDGCSVEPDGTCEHGCESWLLAEGLI